MNINIRKAERDDCVAMMKLVNELAVYEKAPDEVTVSLEHFIESGFSESPCWWAFVAEVNNEIVGFALYYIRYSTWKGQRMYLEDILVTEEYRQKKIGTALFDRLILEAKEKKFSGIVWQVLSWNQVAIRFYKKYDAKFDNEWTNCSIEINNLHN